MLQGPEVLQCVQMGRIKRSATIEAPASALTTRALAIVGGR
jgi:hypothetical protein